MRRLSLLRRRQPYAGATLPCRLRKSRNSTGIRTEMIKTDGATIYVRSAARDRRCDAARFGGHATLGAPLANALIKDHTVIVAGPARHGALVYPMWATTRRTQGIDIGRDGQAPMCRKPISSPHDQRATLVGYELAAPVIRTDRQMGRSSMRRCRIGPWMKS